MRLEEHSLSTDAQIGSSTNLSAVTDLDVDDDVEVLGIVSTTNVGDVEVPTEFTHEEWEDNCLPDWMMPKDPTPKMAFNRTRKRLTDDPDKIRAQVDGEERKVKVSTTRIDKDHWQIDVAVKYTEEELEEMGEEADSGVWRNVEDGIGVIEYREEGAVVTRPTVDKEDPLYPLWETYGAAAREQFEYYQTVHLGNQFQRMIGRMAKHWTQSVKMRSSGAVYFYPARYAEYLEDIGEMFEKIDARFKDSGYAMEMNTWTLISDEQRRKQVERRAREELEERVDDAIETIKEEVADSDESNHDELVSELVGVFERQIDGIDDFVAEYNGLLEAELSIEEVIDEWKGDIDTPEVEEVVEEVMNSKDVAPADTVNAEP